MKCIRCGRKKEKKPIDDMQHYLICNICEKELREEIYNAKYVRNM